MKTLSIKQRVARFTHCDPNFYPYIEKVLRRLPKGVRIKQVLEDLSFEIVTFDDTNGQFFLLPNQIQSFLVLDRSLLKQAESVIIYTIARQLAYKTIGKRDTVLYAKEAEELLIKWGFADEMWEMKNFYSELFEDSEDSWEPSHAAEASETFRVLASLKEEDFNIPKSK
jgi:hypothetical protein